MLIPLLQQLITSSVNFLNVDDINTQRNSIDFLNYFVAFCSRTALDENTENILRNMIDILTKKIEYPDWCTFQYANLSQDEEDFGFLRELLT